MPEHTIGVISDTHGLLRPEALKALSGVEHIIHAGDVGDSEILTALEAIAPVTAVRGNTDHGPDLNLLPLTQAVNIGDVSLYVIHILDDLDLDPAAAGFHAVIFGHSHCPEIHTHNHVLYLNPGSIGPRRFKLPVAMALLSINGTTLTPRLIEMEIP